MSPNLFTFRFFYISCQSNQESLEALIVLPDLLTENFACKKCYSNRECFTYDATTRQSPNESLSELGAAFTSHLGKEELDYFVKWDNLINFEVDAEDSQIARAWLLGSDELGSLSSSLFSLVFDVENSKPSLEINEGYGKQDVAYFLRAGTTSLSNGDSISIGTRVVVSMDTTTLALSSKKTWRTEHRPQMHIARGDVYETSAHRIGLRVAYDDLVRLHKLASRALPTKFHFRMDRDSGATGVGTLRQNLINMLSADKKTKSEPGTTAEGSHLPRLRELLLKLSPPKYEDDIKSDLMFKRSLVNPVTTQIPACDLASLETEFHTLNLDQQSAVRKAFVAKDYTLIQGLPGTGTLLDVGISTIL